MSETGITQSEFSSFQGPNGGDPVYIPQSVGISKEALSEPESFTSQNEKINTGLGELIIIEKPAGKRRRKKVVKKTTKSKKKNQTEEGEHVPLDSEEMELTAVGVLTQDVKPKERTGPPRYTGLRNNYMPLRQQITEGIDGVASRLTEDASSVDHRIHEAKKAAPTKSTQSGDWRYR